jgi:ureidoglycolate amidohydrolase
VNIIIQNKSREISKKRGIGVRFELVNADAPSSCSKVVTEELARACTEHSLRSQRMVSPEYHDSLFMSRIARTGMLFISCRNGYSHRPDEFASPEDIVRGTLVLAETLAFLAG